jgi:hypothetical protein
MLRNIHLFDSVVDVKVDVFEGDVQLIRQSSHTGFKDRIGCEKPDGAKDAEEDGRDEE